MAYSLGDPYRPLRLTLRTSGLVVGILLGGLLTVAPVGWLAGIGWAQAGPVLPWRIAGVALIAVGLLFLLGSNGRDFGLALLVPCLVFHALLAVVLLVGYLRGGMPALNAAGGILLLAVFLIALVGALVPLRYFGAEYRF